MHLVLSSKDFEKGGHLPVWREKDWLHSNHQPYSLCHRYISPRQPARERNDGERNEGRGRGTPTLSLGLSVLKIISAASKSRLASGYGLFLMTITTSFGLGVAEALYHGLLERE